MIEQGEIYLCKAVKSAGDSKKRPALVVSENYRNQYSSTVLVVPFTTHQGPQAPTRIFVPKGEGGLNQNSLALCDRITTVKKILLERGPYGNKVTPEILHQIQEGIMIAIGVY
ncbi:type II toxin-antitoxin system PemK/MazF family toxin [Lyngbya confervoides]|uniref:Type II toxin-antitoxin system PemK/MazF family toxin n=1 Tax=Lyngbya confervoides BDU141951 TaxID=1574623 RepID=A0ABD4TA16_9CYAN|nr:type II toxin-antitoxin system PemK/MazF family toxin [Lyngbya confervoides]MCM1985107.1 type II toxin-antitoxin system PemK/MazF family toxin [Lyngbya confervoides BDU141951]